MKSNILSLTAPTVILFLLPLLISAQEPVLHTVNINEDGSFTPQRLLIKDGDTVKWLFNHRTDAIAPIDSTGDPSTFCSSWKAYDPSDPNEFTGPMPLAASGIFTLGPDGKGFAIDSVTAETHVCNMNNVSLQVGNQFLCEAGEEYATMNWTWKNPNITGVFIRLRWNEVHSGPGDFNWTAMDREIEKAVRNGKMYSLSFKAGSSGTPDWIFDPNIAGNQTAQKYRFQDKSNDPGPGDCGIVMDLGSPADLNFRLHYFNMWIAAAQHIRANNAWYRALAYVKPSGMNLFSHENRLPKGCVTLCDVCNPQVWAEQAGYTPDNLYDFYSKQTALLAKEFPNKDMVYMLIQDGFPRVNNHGEYQNPQLAPLPGGTEQTEKIITQGVLEHGLRFVVAHNGLGPRPQDQIPMKEPCPNEGIHPVVGPFAQAGDGCPNKWVLLAAEHGQVTGFQTHNSTIVSNPMDIESSFQNAWDNSDGIYVEIYEQRFWQAETAGPVLDSSRSGLTIGEWSDRFHQRRRDFWGDTIPDPFPLKHRHAFTRTINSGEGDQDFYYVNSGHCQSGNQTNFGVISIRDDQSTSVTEAPDMATGFELKHISPNPFSQATTFTYNLNNSSKVELKIYNAFGQLVRELMVEDQPAGEHSVTWYGKNNVGRRICSGAYFYSLQVDNVHSSGKLILVE